MKIEIPEILKIAKANLQLIEEKYRTSKGYAKADMEDVKPLTTKDLNEHTDSMYQMIRGVYQYIYALENSFYSWAGQHTSTHLPPIIGAEKMDNALKKLGLDGDYQVQKKTIYASKNARNVTFELDYQK